MPRNPEDYPTAFCPRFHFSNTGSSLLRIGQSTSYLLRFAFCLLLLFLALHSTLISIQAQGTSATLSGTVMDQNGAVVPNVNITVINIGQGFQRTTTTSDEGTFVVPLLPPGTYIVKAEREGFSTSELRDVVLNVNDQVARNIRLSVGNISQTVLVEGGSLIDQSPAVGTIVDRQFVENIPLNGRSFNALIALTPGVVQSKATAGNPGQFSVNGQRANANYFTVDGVSANIGTTATLNVSQTLAGSQPGLTAQGGTNNLVSVDALQEFKVLTSTYAPEFGRTPGGQIQIATRSGTNDFHGTVFDYFRNDVFDANDWFANRGGLKRPALRQNDFGGVLGGPILLPRFGEGGDQPGYNGRNRTFFFFSYEGLRLRQPQVASNVEVPSINLRQTAAPQIQPFLNAFPIPNGPDLGNGLARFSASYSNPSRFDASAIRIDHTFSKKFTMFGRYNNSPSETVTRQTNELSSPFSTTLNTRTATVGATFMFSTETNNDFRGNYSRTRGRSAYSLDSFGGAIPVTDDELFPSFASPNDSLVVFQLAFSTRPDIRLGNNGGGFQRQLNFVDTFSTALGAHLVKFGVDYRRLTPIFVPIVYFQGATFGNATAVRTATASLIIIQPSQRAQPLYKNFSAFAQDTWRTSHRLTLTYGLRWEVNPPPTTTDGNDPFTATELDNPATITLAPRGTPLYKTTYNNFAPRFGVAYQLSERQGRETMIRGGVGIFYDLGTGQTANGFTNAPFTTLPKLVFNSTFPAPDAAVTPPAFPNPPFTSAVAFKPNFKLPRTYQWNLAIEQSLGVQQTISASYVAALGRRLVNPTQLLNPNPRFTSITIYGNDATSDYHSLQLQYQRRLSRGLQALVNYTWAHSIDKVSVENGLGLDRGSSDFDIRHLFSAGLSYDLPTLARGRFGSAVLGNWGLDAIIRAQSAAPVDVISMQNPLNISGTNLIVRPDLLADVPLYLNDSTFPGGRRINPAAFALAPVGPAPQRLPLRQGTLGRNVLRGFAFNQVDLSLRRRFHLMERLNMLFRADIFNIFNHPNFADPSNVVFSGFTSAGSPIPNPTFGLSQSMLGRGLGVAGAGFNALYQVGGPRSLQFSVKFQF